MIKIMFLAPKNTSELLFSSEIDQFEVEELDFLKILTFSFVPTVGISIKINGKSLGLVQFCDFGNKSDSIEIAESMENR